MHTCHYNTSTCMLFFSLIQSVNAEQLLDMTSLLFLSVAIAAAASPCPTTVTVPVTTMYISL